MTAADVRVVAFGAARGDNLVVGGVEAGESVDEVVAIVDRQEDERDQEPEDGQAEGHPHHLDHAADFHAEDECREDQVAGADPEAPVLRGDVARPFQHRVAVGGGADRRQRRGDPEGGDVVSGEGGAEDDPGDEGEVGREPDPWAERAAHEDIVATRARHHQKEVGEERGREDGERRGEDRRPDRVGAGEQARRLGDDENRVEERHQAERGDDVAAQRELPHEAARLSRVELRAGRCGNCRSLHHFPRSFCMQI